MTSSTQAESDICLQAHLDKIIVEVADLASHLAKKNVRLITHIDPATPSITADKKRLIQIMYNLVGNALKFTHKGTVVVSARPASTGQQVCAPMSCFTYLDSVLDTAPM